MPTILRSYSTRRGGFGQGNQRSLGKTYDTPIESACDYLSMPRYVARALRRTLIIHLIAQDADVRQIAAWQGHKDATLILKVYGPCLSAKHSMNNLRTGGRAGGLPDQRTRNREVPGHAYAAQTLASNPRRLSTTSDIRLAVAN
jgi:hypothetical protein